MLYKRLSIIFIIALGVLLAGCGTTNSNELNGTSWELITYRKNAPIPGTNPTLIFEDGKVSGNASCNSYGGEVNINGQEITFGELFWTAMACIDPEGIMEQETDYMQMLTQVESYELEDGQLVLFFDAHETLVFAPIE